MKRKLYIWQAAGFIFTAILGTLLHFLYDLLGQNFIIGMFSSVNESIWEHIKLLYFPLIFFAIIQRRYFGSKYDNFWQVKFSSTLFGCMLIPILYYTYTGALGVYADWFNIAIFFISALSVFLIEIYLFENEKFNSFSKTAAISGLIIIGTAFVILTFIPVHIPIFRDPITKLYGYFGTKGI